MPAVEDSLFQYVPPVTQLQREEGDILLNEPQKDLVPLPVGDGAQLCPGQPLQVALRAVGPQGSGKAVDGEQMHVLRGPAVGDKSDQPPIAVFRWGESGLLVHFPEHAVLGALPVLELAADADPLALIQIILLLDPVEHQTLTALTDVAEGGVDHGRIPPFHNSAALSIARREEGRKGGAYPGRDMQRRGKGLPCSSVSVRLLT